jgi:hypothetical protein
MQNVRLVLRVPADVKAWLAERAQYVGSTLGAEVARCCRTAMEAEQPADNKGSRERKPCG